MKVKKCNCGQILDLYLDNSIIISKYSDANFNGNTKIDLYYQWGCNCGQIYIVKVKKPIDITEEFYDEN